MAFVAEMIIANGSTTSILQAIPNLLMVVKRFVETFRASFAPREAQVTLFFTQAVINRYIVASTSITKHFFLFEPV